MWERDKQLLGHSELQKMKKVVDIYKILCYNYYIIKIRKNKKVWPIKKINKKMLDKPYQLCYNQRVVT